MSSPGQGKRSSEGLMMGGAIGITLYGLVAVFASALFGEEIIPETNGEAVLALAAFAALGTVLGAAFDRRPQRR